MVIDKMKAYEIPRIELIKIETDIFTKSNDRIDLPEGPPEGQES